MADRGAWMDNCPFVYLGFTCVLVVIFPLIFFARMWLHIGPVGGNSI